jgi:hypothetical protein
LRAGIQRSLSNEYQRPLNPRDDNIYTARPDATFH